MAALRPLRTGVVRPSAWSGDSPKVMPRPHLPPPPAPTMPPAPVSRHSVMSAGGPLTIVEGNDDGVTRLLPCFQAPVTEHVWLVAAHGGAGCTTIYREGADLDVWEDAGRVMPVSEDPARPSMVVLCAMGTGRGLEALRLLLADWHEGNWTATVLLGVIVTAPMPHVPCQLRQGAALVGSGAPNLWRLPYIRGLQLDGFPARYPGAYRRVREEVRAQARNSWNAHASSPGQTGRYGAAIAAQRQQERQ